ncbi:MAG: hypothetical protein ACRDUY_07980 [Nitriliruptorales bacterium]
MAGFGRIVRNYTENWRTYDAPVTEKIRLTIRNNARKALTGKGCCGNYGEPGC